MHVNLNKEFQISHVGVCMHDIKVTVNMNKTKSLINLIVYFCYRYPGSRVRVAVPNCAHISLVMWIICENSTLQSYDINDNPVTAMVLMMKFVITRGLNLQERSHGLIGMILMHTCR